MGTSVNMNEKTMALLVGVMVGIGIWVASLPKPRPVAQPPASNFYLKRLANGLAKPLDDLASSRELKRAGDAVANSIADAVDVAAAAQEEKKRKEKK